MNFKCTLKVLLIILACAIAFPVFAQQKMKGKDDKDAKEVAKDDAPKAKKGKEKVMIFNGDQLKVQLYGFVKLDAVYNTADVEHETGPFLVQGQNYFVPITNLTTIPTTDPTDSSGLYLRVKKTASQRGGSFMMDARTTRFGFLINGPEALYAKTSARIECDFWGNMPNSGTPARQGMLRMRHAYGRLDWSSGTYIQIGQWWSVITPTTDCTADMITFIPFGKAGLVFMREPQVLLGQKVGPDVFNVNIELAAARVQSGDDTGTAGFLYPGDKNSQVDDRGPGEASKKPGYRAKIAFASEPVKDLVKIQLAVTGHYQWEKHALTCTPILNIMQTQGIITAAQNTAFAAMFGQRYGRQVRSYSIGGFGNVTVHMVSIVGAYFMGTNMDNFLCGLNQGVAEKYTSRGFVGVKTHGGYGQVSLDFRKVAVPVKLGVGYGGEWKNNANYIYAGKILSNTHMVGTIQFFLNNYMMIGFEVDKIETKYKRVLGSSNDMKYQGSMKFTF